MILRIHFFATFSPSNISDVNTDPSTTDTFTDGSHTFTVTYVSVTALLRLLKSLLTNANIWNDMHFLLFNVKDL